MNLINAISLGLLIITALAGYGMGFGKSLKVITNGPVGFAISIFVCIAFGGTLINSPIIIEFVDIINDKATEAWQFFQYLYIGKVVFYVVLFFVVQIARKIVISIISKIHDSQNSVVVFINRFFGAVLCVSFMAGMVLLAFAGIRFFEETSLAQTVLDKISDSYLIVIYTNNPITFG